MCRWSLPKSTRCCADQSAPCRHFGRALSAPPLSMRNDWFRQSHNPLQIRPHARPDHVGLSVECELPYPFHKRDEQAGGSQGYKSRSMKEGRPAMARAAAFPVRDPKTESLTVLRAYVNATRCVRCHGLMVIEQCFDFAGDAGHLDCLARRCVQCGDIIDPVILRNRRLQLEHAVDPGRKGATTRWNPSDELPREPAGWRR
jgi:hypothetical protein